MSALNIPGFPALQCVISSLRDTAHFTDEEGDLTNQLRELRVCTCGLLAPSAPTAVEPDEPCEKDPRGCWNLRCQLGKTCIKGSQP